jgi:putative transposase
MGPLGGVASWRTDHRKGKPHGYDGAKRLNGRKRHLLVDTLGLLLAVLVTTADVGDRDGTAQMLERSWWRW